MDLEIIFDLNSPKLNEIFWETMKHFINTETVVHTYISTEMTSVREAVQWSYNELRLMWTRNELVPASKVRQDPILLL